MYAYELCLLYLYNNKASVTLAQTTQLHIADKQELIISHEAHKHTMIGILKHALSTNKVVYGTSHSSEQQVKDERSDNFT